MEKLHLIIKRQDGPGKKSRWEEFRVPYIPGMNVITALHAIRENPVTADDRPTSPVSWECNCLEEVCGACTMVINGKARQACSALVDQLKKPIRLEPMSKFPVVRDLVVNRAVMFDNLKKIHAWIPLDGAHALGPGPRMSAADQEIGYLLARCMTCGCCMEACPQVNERAAFIGPAAVSQARLFNIHPTGRMNAHERTDALMGPGGVTDCGNAQNCEAACPKEIPLLSSIAAMSRATTLRAFTRLFDKK